MKTEPKEWLILGITPDGRPFRPSDWAERLCGVLAYYKNGRWVYSNYAHPVIRQGQMGILVETVLNDINPNAYKFIMDFACDNSLRVMPGREVINLDASVPVIEFSLSVRKFILVLIMHQRNMKFPFIDPAIKKIY
ncbi:hypothetical protein Nit79A3_2677 [Nitrosomonas sp. Is79A3]|uniref:DUF3579 domain-containing protein n=1 Tax=Nitrosomonas sp. (strain Is79A3) TaxID=261292 RepID=UPI000215D043